MAESVPTRIGGGYDPPLLDDYLIKDGPLGEFEERLLLESPTSWWNWPQADPLTNLTIDSEKWRVYYKREYPMAFYYDNRFAFGIGMKPSIIHRDFESPDQIWTRIIADDQTTVRVLIERGDFPRFNTGGGTYSFSHVPQRTDRANILRLDNGFSLACTRSFDIVGNMVTVDRNCWWAIGPTAKEDELSRQVLAVKVYDGPYEYEARGTDIRISDPIPLSSEAEYMIYAYDERGQRGLYREVFQGVAPSKRAVVVRGEELTEYDESTGLLRVTNEQITGRGTVRYTLPLRATKLLSVYPRGSEVSLKIRCDGEEWTDFADYDGRAVSDLEIEVSIFNSLASIRVEWEAIKNWEPVGRPLIDILPVTEEYGRNRLRIQGESGEGLAQDVDLYTATHTASANVRCKTGKAQIVVGGFEIASWNPEIDKMIRSWGEFSVNTGTYEVVLTGEAPESGEFVYEIDNVRVIDGLRPDYMPEDVFWYVETEDRVIDASDAINRPSVPVSVGESNRWRIGVKAPRKLDTEKMTISAIYADLIKSGEDYPTRYIKWRGTGKSRVYLPTETVRSGGFSDFIETDGFGATTWKQTQKISSGDVSLTTLGGNIFYEDRLIFQPVTLQNEFWRIEVSENTAEIFYEDRPAGRMEGAGIPLAIAHITTEDIQLDCSTGVVQLRRNMGPRFEGWSVATASYPYIERGAVIGWGIDEDEALANIPFYTVYQNR